jgi:hypothetical protein
MREQNNPQIESGETDLKQMLQIFERQIGLYAVYVVFVSVTLKANIILEMCY